ncbi:MAG: hypothetical protein HY017_34010 [Betaproteobacteria bacterium]|nr:hypothetical protein [Betaproteobacteria bacterium]
MAEADRTSTSRVIADLIESGLDAREQEKKRFFELAGRLSRSREPEGQKRFRKELGRMTFGGDAEGPVETSCSGASRPSVSGREQSRRR